MNMIFRQEIVWTLLFACSFGCSTPKEQSNWTDQMPILETSTMISIRGHVTYDEEIVFEKEVTIYPEAFITTVGNGKVKFSKRLNVLGSTPVFDEKVNIEFGDNCIGTLNVGWFGARGYDQIDDTKAFQKVLSIASVLYNSVNIYIPTGNYKVSEQLVLENKASLNKSINLIGEGMSSSTNQGSSIIWNGLAGASMLLVRNNYLNLIQSMDFAAETNKEVKHNIELRPNIYQMEFRDCSFSGSAGAGSSNINLNEGSSVQVSEISFKNCLFRAKTVDNKTWLTESAIRGGKANTKNFYFDKCSFLGYTNAAIDIEICEVINVSNCTFSHNGIDIVCMLCNLLATTNYSEQSRSFFKSATSNNLAFITMINNYFDGNLEEDYVIPSGAGSLVLLNNNFGGSGGIDSTNLISWDSRNISSIYSIGNFFRNDSILITPFLLSGKNTTDLKIIKSIGDKVGKDGTTCRKLQHELESRF